MTLLSTKAGIRAKEIACLTWTRVTDAEGQIGDAIYLTNDASKGKRGRRSRSIRTPGRRRHNIAAWSTASGATDIARQWCKSGSAGFTASSASLARARIPPAHLHHQA